MQTCRLQAVAPDCVCHGAAVALAAGAAGSLITPAVSRPYVALGNAAYPVWLATAKVLCLLCEGF